MRSGLPLPHGVRNMDIDAIGPVAVIADVHGKRWALEAVLEDIERRGTARAEPG